MSALTGWLLDKSAYTRLGGSPDVVTWLVRIRLGQVRVATTTALEVGQAARTGEDWTAAQAALLSSLPIEHATPAIEARAWEVQGMLARRGLHHVPSVADLTVAATAEIAGLSVLHANGAFDLVAELTGQSVAWLRDGHSDLLHPTIA